MRRLALLLLLLPHLFFRPVLAKTAAAAAAATYVPRFASRAEPVRPARVFAAFARGEMRRFKFESSEMQAEVERIIASTDLNDDYGNAMRGAILGTSRFQILRHLPADTRWYRLRIHPLLLASLRTPIAWNEEGRRCQTVRLGFRDLETRNAAFHSDDLDRYTGIYNNARNVERVVIAGAIDFNDKAMYLVDGNHRSLAFYSRARMEPMPITLYIGLSENFKRDWLGNTYLDCLGTKLLKYAAPDDDATSSAGGVLALHTALKALDTERVFDLAARGYTTDKDARDFRNMTALSIAIVSLSTEIIRATIGMGATPANAPVHVPLVPGGRMDPLLTPTLILAMHADRLHRGWATKLLLAETPVPSVLVPTMSILQSSSALGHITGTVHMETLRRALEPRLVDVVDLLLQHGADPNAMDSAGTSVFIHAAKLGLPRVAQRLLEKGARCNLSDANGWSAFDHAEAQGHREFLQCLQQSPYCSEMPAAFLLGLKAGERSPARIVHANDANLSSIFFTHFVVEQRPLVVRGLVDKLWAQKWSAHAYMRKTFGAMQMAVTDIPYKKYYSKDAMPGNLTRFDQYLSDLERCQHDPPEAKSMGPNYWFGKVNLETPLGQHFVQDVETPFVLLDNRRFRYQADYYQFFAGRPGTGSPQHLHGNAWNALVRGPNKAWFFWPPGKASVSNVHPRGGHQAYDATLTATQKEGDVVFVPLDWGHATLWGGDLEDGEAENNSVGFGVAAEFYLSHF
jgi:hypothetical protein